MTKGVFENEAKKKLKAGELVLCMAVNQMRSAEAPMIAAACRFDAIFVDLERSATSLETAAMICVAALTAGVTPIARVPSPIPSTPRGFSTPARKGSWFRMSSTRRKRRRSCANLRFPPLGMRSAYGTGPALGYRAIGQGEVNQFLNEHELVIAMLETPQAIEEADAIAAVPGIDMVHIGALDVSNVMGIPAAYGDPPHARGIREGGQGVQGARQGDGRGRRARRSRKCSNT